MSAFVTPGPLHCFIRVFKVYPSSSSLRSKQQYYVSTTPKFSAQRINPVASQSTWSSRSSSAINQEDERNQYIDLRTMKVIRAEEANLSQGPDPNATFGVFTNYDLFLNSTTQNKVRQLLFTNDTVPLSDSQKDVVQALLSRRSVFYNANDSTDKDGIFIDIVMRTRLWKQCVVYCADSRKSAEAIYATLCAQLGPERRNEVLFDYGDGAPSLMDESFTTMDKIRVVITSPTILRDQVVQANEINVWIKQASVIFVDSLNSINLAGWEEVILSIPSRILLCIFSREFSRQQRELLPLWIESVQNSLVDVNPIGGYSIIDRIDRPRNCPLLRIFAYNAAIHDSPVQVSLTMLREMYEKEVKESSISFIPNYAECFLHGITMIPAEDPKSLLFRNTKEAIFADLCSLVVADAIRTKSKIQGKNKKRVQKTKRKETTPQSRAAAKRRRENVISTSNLFPAIALVKGEQDTRYAASAIQSALIDKSELHWDDDSAEHLDEIINEYQDTHQHQLSDLDIDILNALREGIGILTSHVTPGIQILVQETFRGGLVPLLVVDTHLGSKDISSLPRAKTILIDATAMAVCDDSRKGLLMTSTVTSLAGREEKDDVGSVIVLWYDESIDDEVAGSDIASTLLDRFYSSANGVFGTRPRSAPETLLQKERKRELELVLHDKKVSKKPAILSSTYNGVLRTLRRFGPDGSDSIIDYTVDAYNGWLERAALHATLEKMQLEETAMRERLYKEDWESIAEHERREAKLNEADRIFKAMKTRYNSVFVMRLIEELKASKPGRILGVVRSNDESESTPLDRKLLEAGSSKKISEENTDILSVNSSDIEKIGPTNVKRQTLAAAVFVSLLIGSHDSEKDESISKTRVICILADGMWTSIPVSDIVSLANREENVIQNVDLLSIPHPATFDIDPDSNWAKCNPVDDTERSNVHRVSDELIAVVAGTKLPRMSRYQIMEFENQKERLEFAQNTYQQSPWFGKNDEILDLRRLRRRAAEIGEKIKRLEKQESQLEEVLFDEQSAQLSNKSSIMAVLEDCHAVSVGGDQVMQLTPIGSLGSILPSDYPIFSAACLCLIDGIESLSPSKLAAFIALVVCSGEILSTTDFSSLRSHDSTEADDEILDLSILHQNNPDTNDSDNLSDQKEDELVPIHSILPVPVRTAIKEIQQALQQLHERHFGDQLSQAKTIPDVVPLRLNVYLAKAIFSFIEDGDWSMVVEDMNYNSIYIVEEFRKVKHVLNLMIRNNAGWEFSENVKETARQACDALNKWPIEDKETITRLIENGVIEKQWSGNTYEKWWRTAKEEILLMNQPEKFLDRSNNIETVQAEIMES